MNISQLEYFKVTCKYENISKAAQELHVSQSAISKSIKELEKAYDAAYRSKNSSDLTLYLNQIKLIKETDAEKINKVLQIVNVSIMKKYSFALSQDDSVEELSEKLSKFPNIEQFKKTLLNFIG